MACLLYASLGLFCGPHREGENKNKFWNGWEIHFTHSISLFRTHSRQNFRIGRICLFFSHFFFFILFLLFTLSSNQSLQASCFYKAWTLSFTPWCDWVSNNNLSSPTPLIVHLCCLLHYTFSQGVFIWLFFFSRGKMKGLFPS